jgi:hypothetical protein
VGAIQRRRQAAGAGRQRGRRIEILQWGNGEPIPTPVGSGLIPRSPKTTMTRMALLTRAFKTNVWELSVIYSHA